MRGAAEHDRRVTAGIDRGAPVTIVVDGEPVRAFEGETVAAALLAHGKRVLRVSSRFGEPRGFYCGMGVCFECVMTIDGRPGVGTGQTPRRGGVRGTTRRAWGHGGARTCQTPVRDGMRLETQNAEGSWTSTPSKSSREVAPPASPPSSTRSSSPEAGKCGCGT